MPRYEDEYPSRGANRRGEESRHAAVSSREDRHRASDRGDTRERRGLVDERLDRTDSRTDPRAERMEVADSRMPGRMDARQPNTSTRMDPRIDRTMEPTGRRREEPQYLRDPRTGQVYAADPYAEPTGRGSYPAEDRMARDDPPLRRRGDVVEDTDMRDYDEDFNQPSKYNNYFVESTGIDREVIQHEICRYLGNDATVRPYQNKDVL